MFGGLADISWVARYLTTGKFVFQNLMAILISASRWDTSKFMVEHYADGDLVNEDTGVGYGPAGHEGLAVWGPDVPAEFLH